MNLSFQAVALERMKADVAVAFVYETPELFHTSAMRINRLTGQQLAPAVAAGDFKGKEGETAVVYPKTDPETHAIAAQLIARGADPTEIYDAVYDRSPINRLRLLGAMLAGISTAAGGLAAYAVITRKMFDETRTSPVDTDSFINYTLGIDGVRIGLLFVELPGEVKISFRSKGAIPINELAKAFGGNGHLNAAGARVPGAQLDDVVKKVLAGLDRFIAEQRLQENA